jgi:uncharacterized membrane protein SpoIIM required for sporulation
MRETTFIDRNKSKWADIETYQKDDPDEIASDFIDLTSDLSYAQTHYPHSKITSYLNFLAARVYKSIYQKPSNSPILDFWKKDFPLILGHNQGLLWLAVALFFVFSILGVICSYFDTNFIEAVLGENYVALTEKNIAAGKPFGIYADEVPINMFLRIFANNIFVGLIIFISGVLLGIGTFYHTFKNGLMVGTFLAMFFKKSLGLQAIFVIMLHGTFELMGLILECMAGLILGLSFLFPDTHTRKQALRKGLIEGSKIFIGTIPLTFMAAFIESYITRLGKSGFQQSNIVVSIFLLLIFVACWVFLIWYFFIYSKKIAREFSVNEYLKTIIK